MRIVNWNCCGILNKQSELANIALNSDVVCISESKLNLTKKFYPPTNFNFIRKDRSTTSHGGGLITLIRDGMQYEEVIMDTGFSQIGIEIQGIKIFKDSEFVHIFNVYIPPAIENFQEMHNALPHLFHCFSNYNKIIISGDFNAHHELWGSEIGGTRGKIIKELITNHSWSLLNNGNATHINKIPPYRKSVPDVSFCSADLLDEVTWNTWEDTSGSDHFPISMAYYHNSNLFFHPSYNKISLNNVKWEEFKTNITSGMLDNSLAISSNEAQAYSRFMQLIKKSIVKAGGKFLNGDKKKKIKKIPNPTVWWTPECSRIIEKRRRLAKEFMANCNDENLRKYDECVKEAKRFLSRTKREYFKKICNELNPSKKIGEVFRILKNFKRRSLGLGVEAKSKVNWDNNLEIDRVLEKIGGSYVYDSINFRDHEIRESHYDPSLTAPISTAELKLAIQKSNSKSSPGIDLVSYAIIKNLPEEAISWLVKLFNAIIDRGIFIDEWSVYNVSLIPKPGSTSFRPIAMSCCMAKIVERVINDRLQVYVTKLGILPKYFSGFRRGRSCYDCLAQLRTDLDISYLKGKSTSIVLLDIEGAYDFVNLITLFKELNKIGIPCKWIKFIKNLIFSRTLLCYAGGVFVGKKTTNKGVPQGSILAPLLFNIYIADIIQCFKPGIKWMGFADDISFYFSHTDVEVSLKFLSENLTSVQKWLLKRNLNISLEKTQLMIFDKNIIPGSLCIQVGETKILNAEYAKLLGVIWDYR